MPTTRLTATYDDVNLVLRLYELRREKRMREARAWFGGKFRASTMEEFNQICPPASEENASFRMVVSYWDMVATFVTSGVLNEELFFETGRELLLVWTRVKHVLPQARELSKDPFQFRNLETVGTSMARWMNSRAPGSYEAFEQRIMALVK